MNTSDFVGDGTDLQSFNIPTRFAQIENDIITVLVNGQEFKNFESLYDIKKNEKGVIIKTGINGGVDIYFGNKDYGYIPDSGEKIQVDSLEMIVTSADQRKIKKITVRRID